VTDGWPLRAAAGFAIALLIAVAARRARALAPSGAAAAVGLGTLAVAAGWSWGALLILYFVSSSALSRWRDDEKSRRTGAVVEKGGERDARQVLANGGAFALAALGAFATSPTHLVVWSAAGAGALAAAAADTWATEIGTLAPCAPRSIRTWRPVPAGTSGAVTLTGTLGMLLGAAVVAALATTMELSTWWSPFAGGVIGATLDTVLGAVVQERRWCERCDAATERRVHDCGTPTKLTGGMAVIDNDAVNVACSLAGAVVSGGLVALGAS
jgi:uncharacterized protein (TIGR00297 family)